MPQPTSPTISIPASLATDISKLLNDIENKQGTPQPKLHEAQMSRLRTAKKQLDAAIAVEKQR